MEGDFDLLKKIRNLRMAVSFVNYLICLYGLYVFDLFSDINISSFAKVMMIFIVSTVILLFGLALTYLKKNSNVLYNIIYTVVVFIIILKKTYTVSIDSDNLLYVIVFTIVFIAIFLQYLHIFEKKIYKIQNKDGEEKEIREAYTKYIKILALILGVMLIFLILLSLVIQTISSYFIIYLYNADIIFTIPAIICLILISLVGVFLLVR